MGHEYADDVPIVVRLRGEILRTTCSTSNGSNRVERKRQERIAELEAVIERSVSLAEQVEARGIGSVLTRLV